MNNFGIAFLITLLGCVVADQPPFPSLSDICESSREPFRQYEDCLSSKMPESFKNIMNNFLDCLEEPSFVDLLDSICEAEDAGVSDEEMFEEMNNCSPDRVGFTEPSMEDERQAEKAQEECIIHLKPYFEIAMEKAAADKNEQ